MDFREYLRLRCAQMVHIERDMQQLYEQMARETATPWLVKTFLAHEDELRERIAHLETLANQLGGMSGPAENPLSRGVLAVHEHWMTIHPPQEVVDLHNADASVATSGMLIPLYQGIVNLARALEQIDVVYEVSHIVEMEQRFQAGIRDRLPDLIRDLLSEHKRRAA